MSKVIRAKIFSTWSLAAVALLIGGFGTEIEAKAPATLRVLISNASLIKVTSVTPNGERVCNSGAAFSQIPEEPNFFIGRGFGAGSLDFCHKLKGTPGFLGLFEMNWSSGAQTLDRILLNPPLRLAPSIMIKSAYDPYVAEYRGAIWVAFECTTPAIDACVVPYDAQNRSLDLKRLTVVAEGKLGPFGPGRQIVGLTSASSPVLFTCQDHIYVYWTVDYFDNKDPHNMIITRGMELVPDSRGRLWGKNSGARTISSTDPLLTTVVREPITTDGTSNHVASITDVHALGDLVLSVASIGGTDGPEICRSTHDKSRGCWRMAISVADKAIGKAIFNGAAARESELPSNVVEYPRIVHGPKGETFLSGNFSKSALPIASRELDIPQGINLVPIDVREMQP